MNTNKLKYLMLSLCFNNVKSVAIRHSNGQPYQYREEYPDRNIIQENNRQSVNGTILEYMINQDIGHIISTMLSHFMLEIHKLPYNDNIFTIRDNLNISTTYQVGKKNHLIKIERIAQNPIQSTDTIYDNINYTAFTLSYMNSHIMQLFFRNNAANNTNIPNSKFYINNGLCLGISNIKHSYYIFAESDIGIIKTIPDLLPIKEEKITTCYDRFKNLHPYLMQIVTALISFCAGIIIPLVLKKN